jgi:hypothetical protein
MRRIDLIGYRGGRVYNFNYPKVYTKGIGTLYLGTSCLNTRFTRASTLSPPHALTLSSPRVDVNRTVPFSYSS